MRTDCFQGRSLEEIDQLFEAKLPAWKFSKFQTDGLAHEVTAQELDPDSASIVKGPIGEEIEMRNERRGEA